MKRIGLFVLGVLAISSSPSAQAPADSIATALLGLPANVREGATVIKWKPDQTYDTVTKGTNGLVCYDRSGDGCHDAGDQAIERARHRAD